MNLGGGGTWTGCQCVWREKHQKRQTWVCLVDRSLILPTSEICGTPKPDAARNLTTPLTWTHSHLGQAQVCSKGDKGSSGARGK